MGLRLLGAILVLSLGLNSSLGVSSTCDSRARASNPCILGHEPFPSYYKLLEFPWEQMNGLWYTEFAGFGHFYSLSMVVNEAGQNQLKIYEIDPDTQKLIGSGIGVEDYPGSNIVKGLIYLNSRVSGRQGFSYRFSLRYLQDKNSFYQNKLTGMTVERDHGDYSELIYSMKVIKVSNTPVIPDSEQNIQLPYIFPVTSDDKSGLN